jgi:hypothetical protein
MYSIYHFFASLIRNKTLFRDLSLESFPYNVELLASRSDSQFPDMAIKLNVNNPEIKGGELIELKNCKSYSIASFNSTIPTGIKDIRTILSPNSVIWQQMEAAGDDVLSHPIREIYYLIRGKPVKGRKAGNIKVCLVHGSFFETIPTRDLIQYAFSKVLEETLGSDLGDEINHILAEALSNQESFSKTRTIKGASVSLRFRIMTQAKPEANILNSRQYPEIGDNTLNFVVPSHTPEQDEVEQNRLRRALSQSEFDQLTTKRIKHPFNGDFQVFQIPLFD